MSGNLLEVTDLRVTFDVHGREVTPVDGVSLTLERGEALGIAGAAPWNPSPSPLHHDCSPPLAGMPDTDPRRT